MGCSLLSAELNTAFPSHFSRSFATKDNTYRWLWKVLCDCGMMAEVASDAEISMLIAAGFPADRTVYDAPTKKRSELERILLLGVHVNVDNSQELEVVAELLQISPSSSSIGLRVNPQSTVSPILTYSILYRRACLRVLEMAFR